MNKVKKRGAWMVLLVTITLLFAKLGMASWLIQTVDSAGSVGLFPSIELDSNNKPHISYGDDTNDDLKYAKYVGSGGNCGGGQWSCTTVDSTGNVGLTSSIDLDSSNKPHISYYDVSNHDLKHAKWTGSIWQIETVFAAGDMGMWNSIALDSSNYPHISFYDLTEYDLEYAKWTGSTWQFQDVDIGGAGDVGWYNSIALDSTNKPHISYYAISGGSPAVAAYNLKHAKWTGSIWQIQTVDSTGNVGQYTSIALDSSNNPHISYYDYTNDDLKYAKYVGSGGNCGGGQWSCTTVDSTGMLSSIDVDSSNSPHISYSYSTLKYTVLCPCSGTACNPLNNNQKCDGCNYVAAPPEVCDGLDNDCDGIIDEGCDDDNDDYCDSLMTRESPYSCDISGSWCCSLGVDCNDTNSAIKPGATEICDRLDNNCDGIVDNVDGGASVETTKCQCYNGGTAGTELCQTGIDEDCNNQIDETGCTEPICSSCSDCWPGILTPCDMNKCHMCGSCFFDEELGLWGTCLECSSITGCNGYPTELSCTANNCGKNLPQGCAWNGSGCLDAFEICNNGLDDDGDALADCLDTADCCSHPSCIYNTACCDCTMFETNSDGCNSCEANCYYDTTYSNTCKSCVGVSCQDDDELCIGDPCGLGCCPDETGGCSGGCTVITPPGSDCELIASWVGEKIRNKRVPAGETVNLKLGDSEGAAGGCTGLGYIDFSIFEEGIITPEASFDDVAYDSSAHIALSGDWETPNVEGCDVGKYSYQQQCQQKYYFKATDGSFIPLQSDNLLVVKCDVRDSDCDGICDSYLTDECENEDGAYCIGVKLNDGSCGDPCANTSLGEDTDESGCSLEQAGCLGSGWNCNSVPWSECDESTNTRFRTLTALEKGCTCTPIDDNPCCSWDEVKNLLPTKASCIKEKPFPIFSTINMAIVIALLGMYYFLRKEHANS